MAEAKDVAQALGLPLFHSIEEVAPAPRTREVPLEPTPAMIAAGRAHMPVEVKVRHGWVDVLPEAECVNPAEVYRAMVEAYVPPTAEPSAKLVHVYSRPECTFNACSDPDYCQRSDECLHPCGEAAA